MLNHVKTEIMDKTEPTTTFIMQFEGQTDRLMKEEDLINILTDYERDKWETDSGYAANFMMSNEAEFFIDILIDYPNNKLIDNGILDSNNIYENIIKVYENDFKTYYESKLNKLIV